MMKPVYFGLVFCFAVFSTQGNAAIFAREDFNYSNGNLAGSNGGLGWRAGWINVAGSATVVDGKGVIQATSNQQASRLISELQAAPPGGSKIVWISFEGRQSTNVEGSTITSSYGGLGLYLGNSEQLLIGKSWPGDYQWKAGVGGGLIGPEEPVSTLFTTMIVARITLIDGADDTLDVWLNPSDTSSVATLGAPQISRTSSNLSFDTLRIRSGENDEAVTSESWTFDAVTAGDELADVVAADSDGDGMLDAWEIANDLIVGVDDSGEDPDGDGLTNLQEYLRSTDPHNPDTDGDGLWDGVETGTGIYVDANDTGTNPLLADTDGDGFSDSEENNSGIFLGISNPGTNPNLADTDGDGHHDRFEALRGSDPTDPTSTPPTGDLALIGADDFNSYGNVPVEGLNGGIGFDFDNSTANDFFVGHTGEGRSDWTDVIGESYVIDGKLHTLDSSSKREFNGPEEGAIVGGDEYIGAVSQESFAGGRVVYLRADMKRSEGSAYGGISTMDFGTERAFVGSIEHPVSGEQEFCIWIPGGEIAYSGVPAVANQDYTLVSKVDYISGMISLWVNPNLNAPEPAPLLSIPFPVVYWTTGAMLDSGGTGSTEWDHFVVARQWSGLAVFPGVSSEGGDFLSWINGYDLDGATGFGDDPDHDGLSNGIEHVLGTHPGRPNVGLRATTTSEGVFTFRHTRNSTLATDVNYFYEWSVDLVNWSKSGETNEDGLTATITDTVMTDTAPPGSVEIEVKVSVEGPTPPSMFTRLKAERR